MPVLGPIWGRTHTLHLVCGSGLWSIMSVLMLTSLMPKMPCVYLCFFTQVELGISTIWHHFPLLTKMNGLLSSFWLVAILASLWDVALFPQQHWHVRIRGASAGSGLLLVNQASAIQCGEQDFPERMWAHSPRGALNSWFIITSWKRGAKSRFVNQVFLFRIYWHDLKICFRTWKSILGFVNPFKNMEINFWTYKTLKTVWL